MWASLQEYHMCGENQAVKYSPFTSIHVLLLVAGLSDLLVYSITYTWHHRETHVSGGGQVHLV